MTNARTTVVCGKCDGKKTLNWTRNANGVCFTCGGAGVLSVATDEIAAVRLPRATVIAELKTRLDRLESAVNAEGIDYGYTMWREVGGWDFGKLLGHADQDVYDRALAAFARLCSCEVAHFHQERDAKAERSALAAKIRTVVRNVRKVCP